MAIWGWFACLCLLQRTHLDVLLKVKNTSRELAWYAQLSPKPRFSSFEIELNSFLPQHTATEPNVLIKFEPNCAILSWWKGCPKNLVHHALCALGYLVPFGNQAQIIKKYPNNDLSSLWFFLNKTVARHHVQSLPACSALVLTEQTFLGHLKQVACFKSPEAVETSQCGCQLLGPNMWSSHLDLVVLVQIYA